MNFLLLSYGIPSEALEILKRYKNILFITTAANPYIKKLGGDPEWLKKTQGELLLTGQNIDRKDLETEEIEWHKYDAIYFSGGNVFYLADAIKNSGLEIYIKEFFSEPDKLFSGSSAGACIYVDYLDPLVLIDEYKPPLPYGLGLVDFAVIPHWGTEDYQEKLQTIYDRYRELGYDIKTIADDSFLYLSI